jgi:regulatory protein
MAQIPSTPPAEPGEAAPGGDAQAEVFDPYVRAVRMLARRELSVKQVRTRLLRHTSQADAVEAAIERLKSSGALDDERVARAYARTAAQVKGRGRDRVLRELTHMGIAQATARRAVDEVCRPEDERDRLHRALVRRARGIDLRDAAAAKSVYSALLRQGFDAEMIHAEMRAARSDSSD